MYIMFFVKFGELPLAVKSIKFTRKSPSSPKSRANFLIESVASVSFWKQEINPSTKWV